MKFSPSQIDVYMDCPQLWEYVYIDNLVSKQRQRKFDKGLYIHELMHVYYHMLQAGMSPGSDHAIAALSSRIQNDLQNATPDNVVVYRDVIKVMMRYVSKRSRKIDSGIRIIGVEDSYEFPVVTPNGHEVILHGIRDLVYKDMRGRVVIRDHKSSEKAGSWNDKRLELYGQQLMYGAVWYKMTGQVPILEVNFINSHNYTKEQGLDTYFGLYRVEHPATVYDRFWDSTLHLIDQMLESPVLPHYGDRCKSCVFHEICLRKARGTSYDAFLAANFEVVTRGYQIRRGSGFISEDNSTENEGDTFRINFTN